LVSNHKVGGGRAVTEYRHPLLARINPYLVCLRELPDPHARRRVRWTPLAASLAATLMALDAAGTLGVRCEEALVCLGADFARHRRVGRTYNGLAKALTRQSQTVLPMVKEELRAHARRVMASIPTTAGWTLLAVDGSKEDLPRTKDNEERFGIGDNGVFPQALVTAIVEVHTGLPWDWRIDKASVCEKNHLMEMAADLPGEALLLADGNFVGYPIWSALHEGGKRFLIRVGGNIGLLTGLWPEARIERHRDIVYAWPKPRRRELAPLRLRLIRVGSKSNPVFLLTNVLDHRRLSKRAAGAVYRKRWGVELFYRTFKRTMGFAKLRSRSGVRAKVELEWGLIAATIAALIGIESLAAGRKDVRRLSPAALLRALRSCLMGGDPGAHAHRAARRLREALGQALRDRYRRRAGKDSRHRPITKHTPKPLKLKPPRIRRATPAERDAARQNYPASAA